MSADELDQAYALLSQALTRVPRADGDLLLARLALLLIASASDAEPVLRMIGEAEGDLAQRGAGRL